jgi:hypothetical protein
LHFGILLIDVELLSGGTGGLNVFSEKSGFIGAMEGTSGSKELNHALIGSLSGTVISGAEGADGAERMFSRKGSKLGFVDRSGAKIAFFFVDAPLDDSFPIFQLLPTLRNLITE